MISTHAMRLAGLALAVASAACVQKPTMHLNHAEVSGVQFATFPPSLGVVMTLVLDVHNPNSYDVAIRGVRGQTTLAGQYILPVTFQAPPDGVWMPAGQTTQMRVPVTVPLPMALALAQQGLAAPTIDYHFVGTADVTATRSLQLEKDNYGVDETGSITRQELLAVIPATTFSNPFFPQPPQPPPPGMLPPR